MEQDRPGAPVKTVGLFPGQGIPAKLVLERLSEDPAVVQEANDVLGFDVAARVAAVAANEDAILPTSLAQPAIFTASMIRWRSVSAAGAFEFLMGHSLGEYAALVASGVLSFEDGLRVLDIRANAMEAVADSVPGGMAAILKLGFADVEGIAAQAGVTVANDNCPGQVVVSGTHEGLEKASTLAESAGGRFALLEVAGPFHSSLAEPAGADLRKVLDEVDFRPQQIPVISNVTARPHGDATAIKDALITHLVVGVRFRESLMWLWSQGVRQAEDFGPGRIVDKLARRTFGELEKSAVTA